MDMYAKPEHQAEGILFKMMQELNVPNVKFIGLKGEGWIVRYYKGKDDLFESFHDMYTFLKTEND